MIEPAVACLLISHENSGIGTFLSGKSRHAQESRTRKILAPRARFELATLRLTAECSTVELPGICAYNSFIVLCLPRSSQPAAVSGHYSKCAQEKLSHCRGAPHFVVPHFVPTLDQFW